MVQFQLLGPNDPIPSGYRLATKQDVQNNKQDLFKVMPGWEIANLANGSVDGASYGGNVRGDIRSDASQKLAVHDPNSVSQSSTFRLLNANDSLPQGYRLATVQDVQANPQAVRAAMPGWEIANLANGSVDGASYGCNTRGDIRNDISQKLAIYDPNSVSHSSTFRLLNINEGLPQGYRLATVQDVQANPQALRAAMPGWEIANLANGSVEGASYGCNIRNDTRNDVSQKLATRGNVKFQLFNVRDHLPPSFRLATRFEVEASKQALFEAMPGWEIANLADGSVEGASYGGRTSTVQRNDVSQKLAVQGR